MKVLLCASAYPPASGGVQSYAYSMALHLAQRGNELWVLARSKERAPELDARVGARRTLRLGSKLSLWPSFAWAIMAGRPQAVFLTHRADFLRPALMWRRLLGLPVVVTIHGNELYGSPRREALVEALKKAQAVITVSRYGRGRLLAMGLEEGKVFAIPNGVEPGAFDPWLDGSPLRQRLGLEGKKILLSVGRLVRVKGFDIAIQALPEVVRALPEVVYVLVGSGPEEGGLKALSRKLGLEGRVIFAGEVPHEELSRPEAAFYNACDLFVMPSREDRQSGAVEAFGIAFLEAAACAKPVVGARSGGAEEAVIDGKTGLLVEPENPGALARAIITLLGDRELSERLGAAGRERVERELNWERAAAQVEGVLR
ncbi:MAG: glycosyltransferase family 4 protein, partial [Nitrospinota bacterium]